LDNSSNNKIAIANAYFIHKIVEKASDVKLIVVMDYADFTNPEPN
jgi:hypothetical protein